MQPLRALLQLAGRLRPAQHQHREDRDLLVRDAHRLVEEVPELRGAASRPARQPQPALAVQPLERLADRRVVVLDDGVAVRGLVAREPQRVERERIGVRRRPLLLDQAAEDAKLGGVCLHARSLLGGPGRVPRGVRLLGSEVERRLSLRRLRASSSRRMSVSEATTPSRRDHCADDERRGEAVHERVRRGGSRRELVARRATSRSSTAPRCRARRRSAATC